MNLLKAGAAYVTTDLVQDLKVWTLGPQSTQGMFTD